MTPDDHAAIAARFVGAGAEDFPTSPLYRSLRPVVAGQPDLLELLSHRRPGQQAPYLFFGAVHYLLLAGAEHPLRDYFHSLVGDAAKDPNDAGSVLLDFCREHVDHLEPLIRTRLVQTNAVRRVVGLRVALAAICAQTHGTPVHLVEVGASAGVHLFVDRYRYDLDGIFAGPPDAEVTIRSTWRGPGAAPPLDPVPPIASRVGIDLHPVDVTDPDERRWLRALVWPENLADAELLEHAMDVVAADPPPLVAGDAIDMVPEIGAGLPDGEPCVVFHAATRMHVPTDRRAAFDDAIDALAGRGPLIHIWLEPDPHRGDAADDRPALRMHRDREATQNVILMSGHGQWLAPISERDAPR